MTRDLPGFYFDKKKNRYFPIRGPIPGASRSSSSSSSSTSTPLDPKLVKREIRRTGIKPAQLLQNRELYGNVISSSKRRFNFQEEYLKIQASQPQVWEYQLTRGCGVALEHLNINVQRRDGLIVSDVLLGGSSEGEVSIFEAAKINQLPNFGIRCMGDCVWPPQMGNQRELIKVPGHIYKRAYTRINPSVNISCLKMSKRHSDGSPSMHHVIITSRGSAARGGSVYTMNLDEPFSFDPNYDTIGAKLCEVTSFNCTVWNADSSSDGRQAAVGTNLGAALIDLETGVASWVLGCKSDVLSIEIDNSGKNVLCGLRNGAIVTIDARQKSEGLSIRLSKHQIPYPSQGTRKPSYRADQCSRDKCFELKGDIFKSQIVFMPSSISCLESLWLYDQYFLASSMDGSMRLYDHRLTQRGPVQSYDGNVNSYTRIGFGIDPYERFIMSGGEDLNLRLWNIKSGQLLYESKFMNLVPTAICWPKGLDNNLDNSLGAWLATEERIYHVQWPWV